MPTFWISNHQIHHFFHKFLIWMPTLCISRHQICHFSVISLTEWQLFKSKNIKIITFSSIPYLNANFLNLKLTNSPFFTKFFVWLPTFQIWNHKIHHFFKNPLKMKKRGENLKKFGKHLKKIVTNFKIIQCSLKLFFKGSSSLDFLLFLFKNWRTCF